MAREICVLQTLATKEKPMTPLAKSLIAAFFAIGIVVAGTLVLRPKPGPVAHAQLTPSQLAEVQQPRPEVKPPAKAPVVKSESAPAPAPEDPDFEDGSGS
jgi:hypothetical protein